MEYEMLYAEEKPTAINKFGVGDYVIYGTNGICQIDEIKELKFLSGAGKNKYFVLKPTSNPASTIFIPVENDALTDKMRPTLNKEQIDELLRGSRGKAIDWIDDRMIRNTYFHDILNSGKQDQIILMIRCLYLKKREFLSRGKKLSSADDTVLKTAEKLLNQEFAYALGIEFSEVGEYIGSFMGAGKEQYQEEKNAQ